MTYQRPSYEQVTIAQDTFILTLRPTLRAAVTLEQRYGMPALERAVDEANFSIITDIILTAGADRDRASTFLFANNREPLLSFFAKVSQPLAELVSMFRPAPVKSLDTTPRTGKPMPWAEFYAGLYDVATGWLGWTPEQAWNATPTEITRAHAAHIEKLKAIHGSAEDKDKSAKTAPDADLAERLNAEGLDPEFDRAGLRALKAKIANG